MPIYQQIIEHVKAVLISGELGPGSRIPPVRELAASFDVNPNTMQKALQELEREGYLYADRTAGRYVTDNKHRLEWLRDESRKTVTEKYVKDMYALGLSKEKLIDYLRAFI